ncbi:hypothetical protein RIR_jg24237.t1 [Rhizophagus irregularis DAOM 181602=DAOM 197198]|uniref:Uncharacterized protein n=1 Tax=Rhizophagus irregularis (strain DAOM 181602 / DAOM 197198 / MUCL 43194) TaxID=747089 RepID=U9UHA8_RHIID|nr:hypothetical protein RIR_jg24237.t1 [Rhizophagus irregularis DAOM 181602=DAOM 197198]
MSWQVVESIQKHVKFMMQSNPKFIRWCPNQESYDLTNRKCQRSLWSHLVLLDSLFEYFEEGGLVGIKKIVVEKIHKVFVV